MEADLVKREGFPFTSIPAAGVHGVGLRTLPHNLWQIGRGLMMAHRIIRRFRPEVMFYTGGYLAVPVALASRLPGTMRPRPANLLFVPDIEPGLALRTLARYADHIALTVGASKAFFSARTPLTVTGYPTRRELQSWTDETAHRALNIYPEIPTLLVFGGSKGARSISRALLAGLPEC
jgi:UDP-N-acetylglucosamine--N-acetylmuramyl-(pentapeptide) pyrophosphoryl-undecaprenol N-acetylglucosamine transferase